MLRQNFYCCCWLARYVPTGTPDQHDDLFSTREMFLRNIRSLTLMILTVNECRDGLSCNKPTPHCEPRRALTVLALFNLAQWYTKPLSGLYIFLAEYIRKLLWRASAGRLICRISRVAAPGMTAKERVIEKRMADGVINIHRFFRTPLLSLF